MEFLKPVFTNSPFIHAKKYKIAFKKPDSEQFKILKKKNQESSFMFWKKHQIVSFFLNPHIDDMSLSELDFPL